MGTHTHTHMDETVAIQSEISMSIVTEHWRAVQQRGRSILRWPWRRRHFPPRSLPAAYQYLDGGPPPPPAALPNSRRHFRWQKHVNTEPVILLFCTTFGLLGTVYPIFLFWARCVQTFNTNSQTAKNGNNATTNSTEFCARIANMRDRSALNEVETDVAHLNIYLQLCSTLPALLTVPIVGAWSDYHGRRTPFIYCQIGSLVYCSLISVASFLYPIVDVTAFFMPAEALYGLFAGTMVFTMASTIIVDECREKLAQATSGIPRRIAFACAIQFVGFSLGNSIASFLLSFYATQQQQQPLAYSLTFILAASSSLLGLLYTQIYVRETHFPAQTGDDQMPFRGHLRHYTLDAFRVLAKRRDGWARLCLCLTMTFVCIEFISVDSSLMYLVLREYAWTDAQYSRLLLLQVLFNSIGTMLIPQLFRNVRWPGMESLLMIGAVLAQTTFTALMAFVVHTTAWVYAISALALVSGAFSPAFRAMLARFVPKAETGRLFAMLTLVFVLCPLASKALVNPFYWATLRIWPAMVFLLLTATQMVVLFGQIIVHFLMLPHWRLPLPRSASSSSSSIGAEEEEHLQQRAHANDDCASSPGDSERSVIGSMTAEDDDEEGAGSGEAHSTRIKEQER